MKQVGVRTAVPEDQRGQKLLRTPVAWVQAPLVLWHALLQHSSLFLLVPSFEGVVLVIKTLLIVDMSKSQMRFTWRHSTKEKRERKCNGHICACRRITFVQCVRMWLCRHSNKKHWKEQFSTYVLIVSFTFCCWECRLKATYAQANKEAKRQKIARKLQLAMIYATICEENSRIVTSSLV